MKHKNIFEEKIALLSEFNEHSSLIQQIESTAIPLESLSDQLKFFYVRAKAGLILIEEALILYEKLKINNDNLLAEINFFNGEYEKAYSLAKKSDDYYLLTDILLSLGEAQKALDTIQNESITARWYYYNGRCYNHLFNFEKATFCHKKAIELYKKNGDLIRETLVLADLKSFTYQMGNLDECSKLVYIIHHRINLPDFKDFPQFRSNCLVHFSYFMLAQGRMWSCLLAAKRAEKLCNSIQQSYSFMRIKFLLATCLSKLGYYSKSIKILNEIEPKFQYLKMDKARYLAIAYSEKGESHSALKEFKKAYELLESNDQFGKLYLSIDEMILLFNEGHWDAGQSLFKKLSSHSELLQNHEAYNYLKSHYARFTQAEKLAQSTLNYHKTKGLKNEISQDLLTISYSKIINQDIKPALTILNSMESPSLPLHRAQQLTYQAICYLHLGNPLISLSCLNKSISLIKKREHFVYEALIFYLMLYIDHSSMNFSKHYEDYQRVLAKMTPSQTLHFNKMISDLKIKFNQTYLIQNFRSSVITDKLECERLLHELNGWIIDLSAQKIIFNKKEIINTEKHKHPSLFLFYLASNINQTITKEKLIFNVFQRQNYNPLTDDNLIYVTNNRLKKLLGGTHLVISNEGGYHLNPSIDISIIKYHQPNSCKEDLMNLFKDNESEKIELTTHVS